MITAVYFDTTTGRIDQILPFDDGTASATIDGFAVPGTDWLDLPDANINEDYIDDPSGAPTLTERPVLYETDKVALLPDGTETITFPVPSGTLVDFEDADDYTTAGADFSFTPPGVGEWVIGFDPPWPYVPLLLTVTAATRQVQSVGIADNAVTPRQANLGNLSNLVVDDHLLDPTLCTASGGTGPAIASMPNDAAALGASVNFYRVTSALAIGEALTLELPLSPCIGGRRISFGCYVKRHLPASSTVITLYIDWYTLDSSGDPTFLSTDANHYDWTMTSGSSVYSFPVSATAPASAVYFVLRMVTDVAASATTHGFDFGGPFALESTFGVLETSEPSGTITVPSTTSFSQIMGHTSNHTSAAKSVRLFAGFTNTSGGARTIDIHFYKNGVALFSLGGISIDDNRDWSREYIDMNPAGDSDAYSLRISTGASSFVADYRYFVTDARFG